MCTEATAARILVLVKTLPEEEARKVLRLAEYLAHPVADDMPLSDFIQALPPVTAFFRGSPVEIQEVMRCEREDETTYLLKEPASRRLLEAVTVIQGKEK